jgi:4-amino-4-deoxychorismate lyase
MGILEGTTQGDVFEWASKQGIPTRTEMITVSELAASDAAWLLSSGRHAVPIRSVNGVPHPVDVPLTGQINSFLLHDRGQPSPQRPQ